MRKIIEQIVKGNGNKQFKGLYDLSVADNTSDLTINEIDSKTLNKIVFEHNTSAEEVEGNMVLFLNKKDLGAFANVTSQDGRPVLYFILNLCAKFSLKSQLSIYGKYGKWIL